MRPVRRREVGLDVEDERHQDMADDEDHHVSREVVGPVMMQLLAADFAAVAHLEEGPKHPALAAARAAPEKPAHRSRHNRARSLEGSHWPLPDYLSFKVSNP